MDRTVQQYQLIERLGAGGMGEVYKARDTRLNRFVALKVLPAAMSSDPERRRRFVQEAQAASALNHPNIITIYDIVEDGGTQYMVVEYVAGKTLLDLIPPTGLPSPQVIEYATQMAEALCAAHAARIIHRDLKPANVMVTTSGLVKLLDFGLAKVEWSAADGTGNTATVLQAPLTVEGTLMGTVNYMSPEQADGRPLDARSDIFSFGAVLYEMLTGRFAFHGNSPIATLTAVLRDEVQPIGELAPGVPPELDRIVRGCLLKNPDQRFQSMRDVLAALTALKRQVDSGILFQPPPLPLPPPAVRRNSKTVPIVVTSVLAVALLIGGFEWWKTAHKPEPPHPGAVAHDDVLSNDSVLEMVLAGVEPSLIVSQIRSSKTNFNLSSAEVIRLSHAGVPAAVLDAMRNPAEKPSPAVVDKTPAPPPPSVPQNPVNADSTVVLGDGLPVRLTFAEDVPVDVREGAPLRFTVAEDVRVNERIAIPKGTEATGTVVTAAKKRVLGIGGRMIFRLDAIHLGDGNTVRIRATAAPRREGSVRPVTSGKNSKDLSAAAGTEIAGFIDGPNTVSVRN